jgi:hypothetical protein
VPLVVDVKQSAGDLKLFAVRAAVHALRTVAAGAADDILLCTDAGSVARAAGRHPESTGGIGRVGLSNRGGGVIPPDETSLRFTRGSHLLLSCARGLRWHELQFKKRKPR